MAKRTKISVANKSIINERAKGCCEYCKSPFDFSTELFSIEHILPISLGGDDELSNLAFACIGCNIFKSNKLEGKDPISQAMTILFNPRIMFWEEHFFWDSTYLTIIGQTAIGRTTINELKLNRQALKNLRRALVAIGVHP